MIVILFLLLIWAFSSLLFYTMKLGISPMPTSSKVKRRLLALSPKLHKVKIIECGCGWGTLLFALAKKYPDCLIQGYELSTICYLFLKIRLLFYPYPNLRISRKDFFKVSFQDASLIVCYLYPKAMQRLAKKKMREGAYLLTHTFHLPGYKPIIEQQMKDVYSTSLFLYRF
ncbi:MAG: SAM-dependent methyltransferase [Parachlamydiales bacterium]|nr:SAM-dependent methyltransferase [Parachlamydiales bacterium]